jgi:hypothetical protein
MDPSLRLHPHSIIEIREEDGSVSFRQTAGRIRQAMYHAEALAEIAADPDIREEAAEVATHLGQLLMEAELELLTWPEELRAEHYVPRDLREPEPINARYPQ